VCNIIFAISFLIKIALQKEQILFVCRSIKILWLQNCLAVAFYTRKFIVQTFATYTGVLQKGILFYKGKR